MLKRKITKDLVEWKNSDKKKCLIVEGARQVGKTYAIKNFGQTYYEELLMINFKETPSVASVFAGDLSVENMLTGIRFRYPSYKLIPGKTLIFFDEIQECEEAITSLKFWTIDGRYDVIASGSLLGIDYKRASSYPVGYVDYIRLYGLDFEEFLWSQNIDASMIDVLRKHFNEISSVTESVNEEMHRLFRKYMAVGGMPEAVQTFADTKNYIEVDRIQRGILQGYIYDIAHYATPEEKIKAEKCFLSLSSQLLDKENHKFQYKEVEKGGRAQKYLSSIEWLVRADIICLSTNVTNVEYDLNDYKVEGNFRAYTTDLSLLVAMRDIALKKNIVEDTILANTRGGIYECAIADVLIKKGYPLYFYRNESTKRELDFIIQKNGVAFPIEVKGSNNRSQSLNNVMKAYNIQEAYKFTGGNVGIDDTGIISLPHYMVMFL